MSVTSKWSFHYNTVIYSTSFGEKGVCKEDENVVIFFLHIDNMEISGIRNYFKSDIQRNGVHRKKKHAENTCTGINEWRHYFYQNFSLDEPFKA